MLEKPDAEALLDQGDIINDCPLFSLVPEGQPVDLEGEADRWVGWVIVLTQACDLAQLKTTKILVAMIHEARSLVEQGILKAQTIRDQVRRGMAYGWYFLPASSGAVELPESIIDLRDLHTVHRAVLQRLIADGKRVGRLATPYREHPGQHLGVTYSRIGLPSPYETEE